MMMDDCDQCRHREDRHAGGQDDTPITSMHTMECLHDIGAPTDSCTRDVYGKLGASSNASGGAIPSRSRRP